MRRRRRRRAARIRRGIRVGMFACLVLIEASVGSAIMGARGTRQEADTEQQQIAAAPVMLQMPRRRTALGGPVRLSEPGGRHWYRPFPDGSRTVRDGGMPVMRQPIISMDGPPSTGKIITLTGRATGIRAGQP